MSDLYRSTLSARIARLPMDLPNLSGEDEEEDQEDGDSIGSLPGSGMGPPAFTRAQFASKYRKVKVPDPAFSPISASGYFETASQVAVPNRSLDMRVYYTPPKYDGRDGTVIICHHGAGYSGLSFACFAKEVREISAGECGVLSVDARRHGKTTCTLPDDDLSIEVLIEDFIELFKVVFPDPSVAPTFVLVGHSMGGSVVTRACPTLMKLGYSISGAAVLDAVEGLALDALPHMHNLLNARPDGFDSIEEAIEWHVTTNTILNPNSARISVPACFTPAEIAKSDESAPNPQRWRTTLRSTAPYWTSWFKGLSSSFLAVRTARILILAGTERLDKELMIGQMQGKFQMEVVPNVGHMLHEDNPTRLANIIVDFWRRNERVIPGVKKVGDM